MENFLKKLTGDGKKKKDHDSSNSSSKTPTLRNPFQNNPFQKKFSGDGKSLGGGTPGTVLTISIADPGPCGVKVEKTSKGGTIISQVFSSTPAETAGLQRGDIIYLPNSNGDEEMRFDQFLATIQSNRRPVSFDIRRIQTSSSSASGQTSADDYARKQAVIAAAEARERAHKAKWTTSSSGKQKPTSKEAALPTILSAKEKKQFDLEKEERRKRHESEGFGTGPLSEQTRAAVVAAKADETEHAKRLGYNPYEVNTATAGQAKTATVAMTHGAMTGRDEGKDKPPSSKTTTAAKSSTKREDEQPPPLHVDEMFDSNLSTILSANDSSIAVKAIGTIRKLVLNATTKGKQPSEEAAKFRKVRLSNAKIKSTIVDVQGGIDLMLSMGFVLYEEGEETFLVYPLDEEGPVWLEDGLKVMARYEK